MGWNSKKGLSPSCINHPDVHAAYLSVVAEFLADAVTQRRHVKSALKDGMVLAAPKHVHWGPVAVLEVDLLDCSTLQGKSSRPIQIDCDGCGDWLPRRPCPKLHGTRRIKRLADK